VSSTGALSLGAVPKRLVLVGGGVIGLEMVRVRTLTSMLDDVVTGIGVVAVGFASMLECACVWLYSCWTTQVTVIEFQDQVRRLDICLMTLCCVLVQIAFPADKDVAREFQKLLKKQGVPCVLCVK
jgi:NADPH-dependent 2,4-dienoyl-CoA reductase/sulfur reductase-like enzyme